jgi:hypothetical protein
MSGSYGVVILSLDKRSLGGGFPFPQSPIKCPSGLWITNNQHRTNKINLENYDKHQNLIQQKIKQKDKKASGGSDCCRQKPHFDLHCKEHLI